MKSFITLLSILTIAINFSCKNDTKSKENQSIKTVKKIDSLLEAKSFFEARRNLKKKSSDIPKIDSLRIATQLLCVFNKLETSNMLADKLFKEYGRQLSDSIRRDILGIQYVNYAKLHEYEKAFTIGEELLKNYGQLIGEDRREDIKNTNAIWKPLQSIPPQTLHKDGTTQLTMARDKANLRNLPVTSNKQTLDFIFDTGANISTVVESTAEKMDMKHIPASIQVGSITGEKVEASLAVADSIHLGNMMFTNVVFLVFPDTALYVPTMDFQIHGILGYPVIEAMKQVTISKTDQFIVPLNTSKKTDSNMVLDFLTPVIELEDEYGLRLSYGFDTGATTSMLYPAYFSKFHKEIEASHEEIEFEYGGAGGTITKKGYSIPFKVKINNRLVQIDSVNLLAKDTTSIYQHYYGNLGQDLISQFDAMTLNFESMYISFD